MLIRKPLEYTYLSQNLGENKACYNTGTGRVIGKRGRTCPAGYVDFYKYIGAQGHTGYDYGSYYKQPIYFPVWAECSFIARHDTDLAGGIGLDCFSKERVHFEHLPKYAGKKARAEWGKNDRKLYIKFRFWHAQKNCVEDGSEVEAGDLIQLAGSTGNSSGVHLHWSMKIVDENGRTLDNDNGYFGAVAFMDWYKDEFILDFLGKDSGEISTVQQFDRAIFILRYLVKDAVSAFQIEKIKSLFKNF